MLTTTMGSQEMTEAAAQQQQAPRSAQLEPFDINPSSYPDNVRRDSGEALLSAAGGVEAACLNRNKTRRQVLMDTVLVRRARKFSSYLPTLFILVLTPVFCTGFILLIRVWSQKGFNEPMAIVAHVMTGVSTPLLLLCVLYYYLNSWWCDTLRTLSKQRSEDTTSTDTPPAVESQLEDLQAKVPYLAMTVECYHYEINTKVHSDFRKGLIDVRSERVVTFRESRVLPFARMVDHSAPLEIDNHICHFLKLYVRKSVSLGDEQTRHAVENARSSILWDNHHRDQHITYYEEYVIDGYTPEIETQIDPNWRPPFYGKKWFWLFTLLGLTLPYRIYVDLQHHAQEYWIVKTVSVVP